MKKLFMIVLFGLTMSTAVNAGEEDFSDNSDLKRILMGQVIYNVKLDEAPALIDCFRIEVERYSTAPFKDVLAVWLGVKKPQTFAEIKGLGILDKMAPMTAPCSIAFSYYNGYRDII